MGTKPDSDVSQWLRGEAERRPLTVMFCDMVGSTALSSRLDAEDLRDVIRHYQNLCTAVLTRHGGFVAAYPGDGILVYFGYPHAYEDAAERAVRAGLEMIQAVASSIGPHGTRIEIRLGVATGLMIVGDLIGQGAAEQVAATGKVPNLAARLQTVGEPGELIIADSTRKLVGGLFECDDLSLHRFKGIDDEVRIWRVKGECREAARYDALRGVRTAAFVGRQRELKRLCDRFEKAAAGEGQVVLLSGEAGIGKSSLMKQFAAQVAHHAPVRVFLQCSPHHQNTPLHPLVVHLQRAARFEPDDPAEIRLQKIERLLPDDRRAEGVPLLAALLSVATGANAPKASMPAKEQKARTLALIADHTMSLAHPQPLLLLVEDAHWMDPTSEELALRILERVAGKPVLVVVTARPEYRPAWIHRPGVTEITLGGLQPLEVKRLVEEVAGDMPLSTRSMEEILAKAEGVPLFAEELARNVLESGAREGASAAAIPLTLHDSLMARLDRLGDIKEIAQVAAALGRRFTLQMLAATMGRSPQQLREPLERLVRAGLIVERGKAPRVDYAFRHALVQDAAYASLLRADTRRLHASIAQVLQVTFPDMAETEPEALAFHCARAGDGEAAARYWLKAGQRAVASFANVEGIRHLQNGIAELAQVPRNPGLGLLEFNLHLALGQACYVAKGPAAAETIQAYARAQELVEEVAEPEQRYMLLYGIFAGYHFASRFELAEAPANRALMLASRDADAAHLCQAHRMLGYICFFRGESARAREHFVRLASLYEPRRHAGLAARFGADCLMASRGFHAVLDCMGSTPESAIRMATENLESARAWGHPATTGWAYAALCYVYFYVLDYEGAERVSSEGIAYCEANNIPAWAGHCRIFRLWAQAHLHGPEGLVPKVASALAAAAATNALGIPLLRAVLAQLHALSGEIPQALAATDLALREIASNGQKVFLPLVLQVRASCLQRRVPSSHAETLAGFHEALRAAQEIDASLLALRAANSIVRIAAPGPADSDARDMVATLFARFDEGFALRDLREAREVIATQRSSPAAALAPHRV